MLELAIGFACFGAFAMTSTLISIFKGDKDINDAEVKRQNDYYNINDDKYDEIQIPEEFHNEQYYINVVCYNSNKIKRIPNSTLTELMNSENIRDFYDKNEYENTYESYENFLLSIMIELYNFSLYHEKRNTQNNYVKGIKELIDNNFIYKFIKEYLSIPENISVLSYSYIQSILSVFYYKSCITQEYNVFKFIDDDDVFIKLMETEEYETKHISYKFNSRQIDTMYTTFGAYQRYPTIHFTKRYIVCDYIEYCIQTGKLNEKLEILKKYIDILYDEYDMELKNYLHKHEIYIQHIVEDFIFSPVENDYRNPNYHNIKIMKMLSFLYKDNSLVKYMINEYIYSVNKILKRIDIQTKKHIISYI